MTIEIPTWLLWTLGITIGIPATIFVVCCAAVGWAFFRGL